MEDTRNVTDEFKGLSHQEIIETLDSRSHDLVIALENTERDFNAGSIVRSANAFGVRDVYLIGRRQWNKRGAMATNKYLHVHFVATLDEFMIEMAQQGREVIAVDNVQGSVSMSKTELPRHIALVFGQEGPGISDELKKKASKIIEIEQFGSTRSINLGAAAAVVMYEWLRRNIL